ncbi:C1-like protein, partial [Tanacetum coccineum]
MDGCFSFSVQHILLGYWQLICFIILATVCLRIQVNQENKEFKDLPPERDRACHEKHPLKLINGAGIKEEKPEGARCFGCAKPISLSDSTYGCTECHFFLHKSCAQLPRTINLPSIFPHLLKLIDMRTTGCTVFVCVVCRLDPLAHGLCYSPNDEAAIFAFCINCCVVEISHKAEADAVKKQAMDEGLFYQCDSCDFWIHQTCTSLASTLEIPQITHLYFAHIKCALSAPPPSTPRDRPSTSGANEDSNSLLHFPMSDVFTDPLKLLHLDKLSLDDNDELAIKHWSHNHSLILNVEPQHNNMPSTSDSIE